MLVGLTLCLAANAQFSKEYDEHGNVTYSEEPGYDYSEEELTEEEHQQELEDLESYIEEREAVQRQQERERARAEQAGSSTALTRRLRYQRCRGLWRVGLKCQ